MIPISDVYETLEEREARLGVKLDRYGLTPEQAKAFRKDVKKEKLKKKMPFLIVLVSALIFGGLLAFAQFLLPDLLLKLTGNAVSIQIIDLEGLYQIGNIPPEVVATFMFVVAGFAWIGLLAIIFKRRFYAFGCKLVEGKKKERNYSVLPFMRPYDKEHDLYHKFFGRCPVCGHELKVTDSFNNNGKVVKKSTYFSTYGGGFRTHVVGSTPREEHTEYECSHCHFKFKSSYKAEYFFKSKDPYTTLSTKLSDCYVLNTFTTTALPSPVKMDKEAEQILAEFKSNSYKVDPDIWVKHSAKKLDNWSLDFED